MSDADRAADFEAVDLRQHQVEDHQIGWLGRNRGQRVAARRDPLGREPGFGEVMGDELCDVRIVLDDEDARRHARPFYRGRIPLTSKEVSPSVTFRLIR